MDHILSLATLAFVSLLAAISPGPDFFLVLKNSLFSRKTGFITALGVSFALIFHLAYTLVGLAVLIQENALLYHSIKIVGAVYLLYLGFSSIKSSFKKEDTFESNELKQERSLSNRDALKQGFLTNLLNPKAAVFFVSLFSQFINAETPTLLKIEFALVNWGVTLLWFLFLAYMVTNPFLLQKMNRFRLAIDRAMGGALILISLKIMFVYTFR